MILLTFDTETTGVDTLSDRVIEFYAEAYDTDNDIVLDSWYYLINPGVEVPTEASDIHGFTTEFLRVVGVNPEVAFWAINEVLWDYVRRGATLCAMNLNFDASILNSEFERYGLGKFPFEAYPLFDPLVVDRAKDKYRKGKRKLLNLADHYGVPYDEDALHGAEYDVQLTREVSLEVMNRFGTPTSREQAQWYREWATGLQEYLRRTDPDAVVDSGWPIRLGEGRN